MEIKNSNPHNKIIHKLCKEELLPLGVFQKGSSRVYIDDNGYYFTVIEFQPSSFAKGTYLNVGLHFLWQGLDYISFDFPPDLANRVRSFVEYQDEAQFTQEVREYVAKAAECVQFYRKLRDPQKAKRYIRRWARRYRKSACAKNLETISRLDDEEILQTIRMTREFWRSKASMKKMKHYDVYDYAPK